MGDFQKLDVWVKAHRLSIDITRFTATIRRAEGSVLKGQLKRSVQSVPATIAEGAGKTSDAEFARFLDMALGSASETHSHLITARDLGFLSPKEFYHLADRTSEVRRMLYGLLKAVRGSEGPPRREG